MYIADTFVLNGKTIPAAAPRIGWHTILPDSTVTCAATKSGSSVDLLSDYMTFDAWDGTANTRHDIFIESASPVTCDYIGIAAHNLSGSLVAFSGTSCLVVSYYSGVTPIPVGALTVAEIAAYNDRPVFLEFPSSTASRWLISFQTDTTAVPYIGVLFLGESMKFERGIFIGHSPATYNRRDQILKSASEGGQFLGRSIISEGGAADISLNNLSSDYIRYEWDDFQDHARRRPFFFAWWPEAFPNEIIYGWTSDPATPSISGHHFYSASFSMQGLI